MKRVICQLSFFFCILMTSQSHAQEIQFTEQFAIAKDRTAALEKLIPGTEDYYYFYSLHYQNTLKLDEVDQLMKPWVKRFGNSARAKEIQNRQALLKYDDDPKATLDYLKRELGVRFNHQRQIPEAEQNLPTKLDPKLIVPETLIAKALRQSRNTDQLEQAALPFLANKELDHTKQTDLLNRITWPDFPNLVQLVDQELKDRNSRGFGRLGIHNRLTQDQLDELLRLRPKLKNETNFVNIYLSKLLPSNDIDWTNDPAEQVKYLDRLWAYVSQLDPVHNSLKACVRYHQLLVDQKNGKYDREKFLSYVKLPRRIFYVNQDFIKRNRNNRHEVNLNADFRGQIRMIPIQNDEPMVRDYLHQFLKTTADLDEFSPYIESNYLKTQLATTNILQGLGDTEKWASLLSPEAYKALVERTDLDFSATNQSVFQPADGVELQLFTKNIDKLIVKIFEVNSENYYRRFGREIDTDINLDGLVPNDLQTHEYSEAPAIRTERTFSFPKLDKRGVYVIDFIGNGKSSRAIVRKGQLSVISKTGLAGHEFTVVDEQGTPVSGATLWIAGKTYEPAKNEDGSSAGKIIVPFSSRPGRQSVIIRKDDFCSLEFFNHQSENYSLNAGLFVDRESLLRARKSQVVIRPQLTLSGNPIPAGLLEDVSLKITTTDLDGNSSTTTKQGLELSENGETIVSFQVPPRLQTIQLQLTGNIESMSLQTEQTIRAASSITVNQIDGSDQIQDVHLFQSGAEHKISVRGKSGEARPRQAVLVKLKSEFVKQPAVVSLQTNADGVVDLGSLGGIQWVSANCTGGKEHQWQLERNNQTSYSVVHSVVGNTVRIPAPAMLRDANPNQVSLFEVRGNSIVKNWIDALTVGAGLVGIKGLEAGDYQLTFKDIGQTIQIRVTDGEVVKSTIVGKHRRLETRKQVPLHIQQVTSDDGLKIKLGGTNKATRVHVFASRYLPRFDAFNQFQLVRDSEPLLIRPGTRRSTFMAGRKIGDEYQYILDRRYAKKFVGNMLERPSLLLNPFAIDTTENQQNVLNQGGQFGNADDQAGATNAAPKPKRMAAGNNTDFSNLDFLKDGTIVLANLKPDAEGNVVVDAEKLGEKQHLVIVAADMFSTVQRTVAATAGKPAIRDLRLANAFDPELNVSQSKQAELLEAGKAFLIENVLTAKFQSFDDLSDIYSVLQAINPHQHLTTFNFVLAWPDKTQKQKQELYSEHACHELNFFIAQKDPEFFASVVKPYIVNKREKTFVDHYLLKENLEEYLTPWRFAKLNSVERILLSKRLESQRQDLLQHLDELYRLNPTTRVYAGQLYDTTVTAGFALSGDEYFRVPKIEAGPAGNGLPPVSGGRGGGGGGGFSEGVADRGRREIRQNKSDASSGEIYSLEVESEAPMEKLAELSDALKEVDEDEKRFDSDFDGNEALGFIAEGKDDSGIALGRRMRKKGSRLYRRIAQTQEWIEQQYYRLLPAQHNSDRVAMNRFWQDYAKHDMSKPFVSSNFAEAHHNFTEMMFTLSVLDLPFKAAEHKTEYVENQMRLTPGSPMIALHQQMKPSVVERRNTTVLVSENFFQKNDRYRFEGNQRYDKFINDKFSAHTLYGGQVVITNPTSSPRGIELLVQIPKGAVVASSTQETKTIDLNLAPFSTQSFEYSFYFPAAGDFTHFPAHVSSNEKVVAVADQVAFKVVDEPVQQDKGSWAFVSQNGSNAEVIDFLNRENVLRLDLSKIAFRMKDDAFFKQTLKTLRNRYAFDATIWSYSLMHDHIDGINQYLDQSKIATRCGSYFQSTPLTIEPVVRTWYEHHEYSPLINARAHQVGKNRKILNPKFYSQYHKYMSILAHQANLNAENRMALTYYLLLQDRIDEAIEQFEQVDKSQIAEQIQYDYCHAYVNMYLEKPDAAAAIAQPYADYSVDKWRKRFQTVLSHVNEIRTGQVADADPKNQVESQTELANKAPSFEFEVEEGEITVNYQNLSEVQINYYQMDIELLFSRNPFGQSNGEGFSLIRPNQSQTVALDDSGRQAIRLPEDMRNKNVTIEINGKNQSKSKAYYAHQLSVQMIENFGQLKLTTKEDGQAIPKAYVKVYARNADGSIKFFKDGYTDLRGRFDYATQSNYPMDGVQKFSILVMSEEFGTTVRQATPPKE
jgi:transcription termination factor NusB